MKISETGFDGLKILIPDIFRDKRGYFFESYKKDEFLKSGIPFDPIQDNESKSSKGVVRGLHYQLDPHSQAKLVRVVEGIIYDVALDLRRFSPTYGKWFGIELDTENRKQLFIPKGFAHGFSVLSDYAVIQYKIEGHYNPAAERGISATDPVLNIDWKINSKDMIFSDKDLKSPLFKDAEYNF